MIVFPKTFKRCGPEPIGDSEVGVRLRDPQGDRTVLILFKSLKKHYTDPGFDHLKVSELITEALPT